MAKRALGTQRWDFERQEAYDEDKGKALPGQFKIGEFQGVSDWLEVTDRQRECGRWGHCVDEGLIAVCDKCCCMHLKEEGIRPVIGLQASCKHDWIVYEGRCGACGAKKNEKNE